MGFGKCADISRVTVTNIRGALVTMPHKVTTMDLVDEVTPTARIAGATNAVVRRADGTLLRIGHHLDRLEIAVVHLEGGHVDPQPAIKPVGLHAHFVVVRLLRPDRHVGSRGRKQVQGAGPKAPACSGRR